MRTTLYHLSFEYFKQFKGERENIKNNLNLEKPCQSEKKSLESDFLSENTINQLFLYLVWRINKISSITNVAYECYI